MPGFYFHHMNTSQVNRTHWLNQGHTWSNVPEGRPQERNNDNNDVTITERLTASDLFTQDLPKESGTWAAPQ